VVGVTGGVLTPSKAPTKKERKEGRGHPHSQQIQTSQQANLEQIEKTSLILYFNLLKLLFFDWPRNLFYNRGA